MATTLKPVEIFYSYSHRDMELRNELEKHLSILKRQNLIANWHDRKITAGSEWKGVIDSHLNSASIILLLISPDFIASDYCYDIEMARALERHDAGEACVIPIILRPVKWSDSPFGRLQVLPENAKPVTKWENLDEAFLNVTDGVEAALKTLRTEPAQSTSTPMKLFISYKRNSQLDEELSGTIERFLLSEGYEVFVNRKLKVGTDWVKEVEQKVRESDVVIPLLSTSSISSEMLTYEVQVAHEAAQLNRGKPRLLPVRVAHDGLLPEPLASILRPLQIIQCVGRDDESHFLTDLLASLRNPGAYTPQSLNGSAGGGVPLDARYYIPRPADELFRLALQRQELIIGIKGARQMGKTSLLARGLQQAREWQSNVVVTDLQILNESDLASPKSLFLSLGRMLTEQLDLDSYPDDVWTDKHGPNMNFERYLRRTVLENIQGRLVWGLDEVDRLFSRDYANDVFGLFRVWFNQRAFNPNGRWNNLTLAFAYATEPHLFITDPHMSPFNVGTRLQLEDFTLNQVAEFNNYYNPLPLKDEAEVESYFQLLNGHPYLVHRGLDEMATRHLDLAAFKEEAVSEDGPFSEHLRRILVLLARNSMLRGVLCDILQGKPCPNEESFYRLRSAGVISGRTEQEVRPRCELYRIYLSRHLLFK